MDSRGLFHHLPAFGLSPSFNPILSTPPLLHHFFSLFSVLQSYATSGSRRHDAVSCWIPLTPPSQTPSFPSSSCSSYSDLQLLSMSRRQLLTTVLGVALGGLLVWRVYHTKRKRASSFQKVASLPVEATPEVEGTAAEPGLSQPLGGQKKDGISLAVACKSILPTPAGWLPWSEKLLATKLQTVSSENEWLQLWPCLQEELSVFPVLGFDCEWVKNNTVTEKEKLYTKQLNYFLPSISSYCHVTITVVCLGFFFYCFKLSILIFTWSPTLILTIEGMNKLMTEMKKISSQTCVCFFVAGVSER